jgi:hypothetical protein
MRPLSCSSGGRSRTGRRAATRRRTDSPAHGTKASSSAVTSSWNAGSGARRPHAAAGALDSGSAVPSQSWRPLLGTTSLWGGGELNGDDGHPGASHSSSGSNPMCSNTKWKQTLVHALEDLVAFPVDSHFQAAPDAYQFLVSVGMGWSSRFVCGRSA